jgi:uncharacterized protein (TIGR03435 family)
MLKSRLPAAVGIVAVVSTIAVALAAQAPAPPAFEVASVKLNKSQSLGSSAGSQGERWTMTNGSIAGLILSAYPPSPTLDDLPGAPDWVRAERYDVNARATFVPTKEQERTMLQGLLAERFKFVAHYETQERPIYNLVVARADGRLGPQIRHIDLDCDHYKRDPNAPPTAGPDDVPPCAYAVMGRETLKIISGGRTMQALADAISYQAGRPVFDKTGLTGFYAFTLEDGGYDPNGLSLFTALQEQLGLRLESTKGPVDILVVDHIERPTPD